MTIEKQLNNIDYKLTGALSYGNQGFNYNSTSLDLSELNQYRFEFSEKSNDNKNYSVNNVFDVDLYNSIQKSIDGLKFTEKQTHISDTYRFYDYHGMRVIIPIANWYDFLIINSGKNIFIVSKKNDYSIFVLRDLIKSELENNKSILFHSASIIKDAKSMLIIGNKGFGKSTFAFGMADAFDYSLISNDRTYLNQDGSLTSFPIDIRLGKGTVNNNTKLKELVSNNTKFSKKFAELGQNDDKITVFPYDINQTIPMINGSGNVKLSHLIIPQFDMGLKTGNLHISIPKNIENIRNIVHENCLTPDDPIWIRSLLGNDIHSVKDLKDMSEAKIEEMLKSIETYIVKYKNITKNSKIIKEY